MSCCFIVSLYMLDVAGPGLMIGVVSAPLWDTESAKFAGKLPRSGTLGK
jgi:hypothetical protein